MNFSANFAQKRLYLRDKVANIKVFFSFWISYWFDSRLFLVIFLSLTGLVYTCELEVMHLYSTHTRNSIARLSKAFRCSKELWKPCVSAFRLSRIFIILFNIRREKNKKWIMKYLFPQKANWTREYSIYKPLEKTFYFLSCHRHMVSVETTKIVSWGWNRLCTFCTVQLDALMLLPVNLSLGRSLKISLKWPMFHFPSYNWYYGVFLACRTLTDVSKLTACFICKVIWSTPLLVTGSFQWTWILPCS